MLKDITFGQYYPGNSILHKSDPRTKILAMFVLTVVVFILNSPVQLLLLMLFTLSTVFLSGVPFRYPLKSLKPVLAIVIFASVVNIFMTSGKVIFSFWFIQVTLEGVILTFKLIMRITTAIIAGSILTLTATPLMLADGLEKLMNPMKKIRVPVHEMAMMMTIALRFIPTLMDETDKIMKAQASRGADFESGNILKRAKSFIPVLVPLFISAFRRADDLAVAMEARCYRGGEGRTKMRQLKFSSSDIFMSVFFAVIIILICILPIR